MIIKTLEQTSMSLLTDCFNEAFSDYLVTFHATEPYLVNRWKGTRVDYALSYGVWAEEQLVGFVVHGIDERRGVLTAHNNGTGVIPSHRGHRSVDRIYERAIPDLKERGVGCCTLEVICENERAIKVYQRIGFELGRQLDSYSGEVSPVASSELTIERVAQPDWSLYPTFWDIEPAWEQNRQAVEALQEQYVMLELRLQEQTIGYAIFNASSGSMMQFGIDRAYRGKGYGRFLFGEIGKMVPVIKVNNADAAGAGVGAFLNKIGLEFKISQFEMEMTI